MIVNLSKNYAKMQHDVANGRLLSNEEKSALELMVEVNKGSSEYKALLADIGKKIVEGAIPKMEGKHFVILGMTAILSWSSSSVIKEYLVGQTDHKKMELQLSLSKEETRRLELMKEASNKKRWENDKPKLPEATHVGEMKIGDSVIKCAVLEDGRRVLTRATFVKAIGRTGKAKGGHDYDDEFKTPVFLTANNLKPFIPNELTENSTCEVIIAKLYRLR